MTAPKVRQRVVSAVQAPERWGSIVTAPGWHRDKTGALDLHGQTGLRVAYILPCVCAAQQAVAWGLDGWVFDRPEHGHAGSEAAAQALVVAAFEGRDLERTVALARTPLPPGGSGLTIEPPPPRTPCANPRELRPCERAPSPSSPRTSLETMAALDVLVGMVGR